MFSAYVGTGLFVHKIDGQRIAYSRLLRKARTENRQDAIAALEAIGPPPHGRIADMRTQNEWAATLTGQSSGTANRVFALLLAPRYSLTDIRSYLDGFVASDEQFDLGAIDLRMRGRNFAVPVIIIQGGEDYGAPVELARSYVDLITAPYKRFVVLDGAGHTALTDDSGRFAAALDEHVRPIVEKRGWIGAPLRRPMLSYTARNRWQSTPGPHPLSARRDHAAYYPESAYKLRIRGESEGRRSAGY